MLPENYDENAEPAAKPGQSLGKETPEQAVPEKQPPVPEATPERPEQGPSIPPQEQTKGIP